MDGFKKFFTEEDATIPIMGVDTDYDIDLPTLDADEDEPKKKREKPDKSFYNQVQRTENPRYRAKYNQYELGPKEHARAIQLGKDGHTPMGISLKMGDEFGKTIPVHAIKTILDKNNISTQDDDVEDTVYKGTGKSGQTYLGDDPEMEKELNQVSIELLQKELTDKLNQTNEPNRPTDATVNSFIISNIRQLKEKPGLLQKAVTLAKKALPFQQIMSGLKTLFSSDAPLNPSNKFDANFWRGYHANDPRPIKNPQTGSSVPYGSEPSSVARPTQKLPSLKDFRKDHR